MNRRLSTVFDYGTASVSSQLSEWQLLTGARHTRSLAQPEPAIEQCDVFHLCIAERDDRWTHVPAGDAEVLECGGPEGHAPPAKKRHVVAQDKLASRGEILTLHGMPKVHRHPRSKRREGAVIGVHSV